MSHQNTDNSTTFEEPTKLSKEEKLFRRRHSLAHVLAQAVLEFFPEAQLAIGPPIEDGFYYDFLLPRFLKEDELPAIQTRMEEILATHSPFERQEISYKQAQELFNNQTFKRQILEGLPKNETICVYKSHSFLDLCKGPHVKTMQEIAKGSFKLTRVAGAYWRGDETQAMLQRIYGVAFASPKDLKIYLKNYEEALQNDHRRLGKSLDLFSFDEAVGPGLALWHPNGSAIRTHIEDYWRSLHRKHQYEFLFTPHIGKAQLWETSGHLDHYRETMFSPLEMEKDLYYAKPMNCPFHIQVYKQHQHSYKQLPYRYAELGTVYRYEKSGVLHGLLRVRGFTQDDGHVICRKDQIEQEIEKILSLCTSLWKTFGFSDVKAFLSKKPDKAIGEQERWDLACQSLENVLEKSGLPYEIDEKGGAFYGPKIDLKVQDSLKREWQTSTIQFDFNLPLRFKMSFINDQGEKEQPYVIHRALFGSLERFFGILIEHYKGRFPLWLSHLPFAVLPVHDEVSAYAKEVKKSLEKQDFSVLLDENSGRLNAKVKAAQEKKIPYMLILGKKEEEQRTVSVRLLDGSQEEWVLENLLRRLIAKREGKELDFKL